MKKKELEKELGDINQRLSVLGDLNDLLTQCKNLPSLVSDSVARKSELESFLKELPPRGEELFRLVSEAGKLNEQVVARNGEISELSIQVEELRKKTEELIEQVKIQLGIAANAKLASTFEGVSDNLTKEKKTWFWWLISAVLTLIIATGAIVWWQIHERETLYHLSFLIRIALLSPIVYFVVFINREYNRARSLIEEYTFKAAIARAFEAYKEIVQSADIPAVKGTFDFIVSSINDLYSSPMVNIKENNQKEGENSPDPFSKVKEVLGHSED